MNKKYILPSIFATLLMASCADEFNPEFPVERPVDLAKVAELEEFQPLKEYIDRGAHPTFKLGAALDAAEFNKLLTVYNVGVSNFDEVVAGNAMKYASVVNDKGEMDFGTVNSFVTTADKAGITVYGHTLAWHAQQRPKYLNTLLADKPKPVDPNAQEEKEVTDYTLDFGSVSGLSWNGCPADVTIEYGKDGCLVLSNTAPVDPWYAFQYWVVNGIGLKTGTEYTVTLTARVDGADEGKINVKIGDWGGGFDVSNKTIAGGSEFAEYTFKGAATMDSNGIFIQHCDGFVGALYLKSLTIKHTEISAPSDVEYKEVWTNEFPDYATLKVGDEVANFVIRDANNNDAPAVLVDEGGVAAVKVVGKTATVNPWDTQFFVYTPNKTWTSGEKYRFHMKYKATKAIGTDTQVHAAPGTYKHWQMLNPNPSFTTDWQEKTWEGTIPSEGGDSQQSIAFNLNKNRTKGDGEDETVDQITYYFADFSWESCKLVEVPKVEIVHVDYVNNSDMEDSAAGNFARKENNGAIEYVITPGVGKNGSRGVSVTSNPGAVDDWDTQFWIVMNEGMWLEDGQKVTVEFDYKASTNATGDTQAHGAPGGYQHWNCVGSVNFTTDWQHFKKELTVDGSMAGANGMGSIAFNLSKDRGQQVTYYFDNIAVWSEEEHEIKSTIPLTPEEKHDTLVWAMDKWIAGMMDACEGKVKAWDVVNEAISGGGDDGEGNYPLQHGTPDNTTDFFWQDNMGDLEYVRQAVRLARKYYAQSLEEAGGDDGQLKLFINDYNLESDWDHNKKVKSLINWIKKWEADGVTKIDGIGSQMHISYYEDPETLESKKNGIVESFKLMAATGKLVRISELDMGYVKADGTDATLDDMTSPEQVAAGYPMEKAMEEYYKWIIEQYFTIIPSAQQYGITQWCLTDAPKGAGWRPDTPVGIWDNNWNRKFVYRGWTEALTK